MRRALTGVLELDENAAGTSGNVGIESKDKKTCPALTPGWDLGNQLTPQTLCVTVTSPNTAHMRLTGLNQTEGGGGGAVLYNNVETALEP